MIPEIIVSQHDFSAGQLNADSKRADDDKLALAGARTMLNWRISGKQLKNRPGRTALFPGEQRTDKITVAPGVVYYLCFGNGTLKIRDEDGAIVGAQGGFAWTTATAKDIVFASVPRGPNTRDIVMTFTDQRPWIARWASPNTWTFLPFNWSIDGAGAILAPFYRLGSPDITMDPSGSNGSITLTASKPYFAANMVGSIIRRMSYQMLITAYIDTQNVTALVLQRLPISQTVNINGLVGTFVPGEIVTSSLPVFNNGVVYRTDTVEGEVVSFSGSSLVVNMTRLGDSFTSNTAAVVVGPSGRGVPSSVADSSPAASFLWDEEVASDLRGWPKSCFFDQGRLGFCNFPAAPRGVSWSGINLPEANLPGAEANDAIFELVPGDVQVYHVIAGSESAEFVITDGGVFYLDISASNPLAPGSVSFIKVTSDAAANVKPISMPDGIAYVTEGGAGVSAILATGQVRRPFIPRQITDKHSDLFTSVIALAAPDGGATIAEHLIYALNADGSVVVGFYESGREWVGWLPWTGGGSPTWISGTGSQLTLTSTYTNDAAVSVVEKMDTSYYLDTAALVNAVPTAMQAGTEANFYKLLEPTDTVGNMTSGAGTDVIIGGQFNRNQTGCANDGGGTSGSYTSFAGVDLGAGNTEIPTRFVIYSPANDSFINGFSSGTVKFRGSNDAVSWTDLTTDIALSTAPGLLDVTSGISASQAYRYYGPIFKNTSGSAHTISLAQMFTFATQTGAVRKTPTAGTGTLWWLAGGNADLMDGVLPKGPYAIDADGNITAVSPGEDMSSATLVAGVYWPSPTLELFVPNAPPGASRQQRTRPRFISKHVVTVKDSTGFSFRKLYSGPTGPNLPSYGAVLNSRRIPAWNVGENQAVAPPMRETTHFWRPAIRAYDPRVDIIKDVPGPLTIVEVTKEVTI